MKFLSLCLVAASLSLASCAGKGAAFLTIEAVDSSGAALSIPGDVDRLMVKMADPSDGSMVLEKEYALTGEQRFPLSLAIQEGDYEGKQVSIDVTAFKGQAQVSKAVTEVLFDPKALSSVTVRLFSEGS